MPRSFLLKKYYPRNDEGNIFPLLELSNCITKSLENDSSSRSLYPNDDEESWNYEYEKSYWFDTSHASIPKKSHVEEGKSIKHTDGNKHDEHFKQDAKISINNIKTFITTMIRPIQGHEKQDVSPDAKQETVNLPVIISPHTHDQESSKHKYVDEEEKIDIENIREFLKNNRTALEEFAQETCIEHEHLVNFIENNHLSFVQKQELRQWYKEKSNKEPTEERAEQSYTCKKCGKIFTYESYLERHIKYVCPDSTGRTWKCNYCGKAFQYPCYLRRHVRSHTGESPYKCDKCERAFVRSTDLQRHIRNHTGEKPYCCSQCSRAFARSTDLKRHMRTHTGEKPYKCWKCGKSFSQSGSLQTHVHTHTKENSLIKMPEKILTTI